MNRSILKFSFVPAGVFFLALILFHDIAMAGAIEGIQQCVQVIIPSLFPLFFVTGWLNNRLGQFSIPILKMLRKPLFLPENCDNILLMGLLGGYPVGAKAITDAYHQGNITQSTAKILLGYCNNAGPAFIFGVCHMLFTSNWIPWIIWGIQITSALISGLLLPHPNEKTNQTTSISPESLTSLLRKSISTTVMVCAWVMLFKMLLYFLGNIYSLAPILPFISGFLELSNGALMLVNISSLSLRFMLFNIFLSVGGLCVLLQTLSTIGSIGSGMYLPGKCIQCAVCTLISATVVPFIFNEYIAPASIVMPIYGLCIIIILVLRRKYRNYR